MPDYLVRLYDLPPNTALEQCARQGVTVRPAVAPELHIVQAFVAEHFGAHWVSECTVSFSRQPVGCVVAVHNKKVIGFACVEATCRAFFGPTGVAEAWRGKHVGQALLIMALEILRGMGYAYGIIGSVGDALPFYQKSLDIQVVEKSDPGIYRGML